MNVIQLLVKLISVLYLYGQGISFPELMVSVLLKLCQVWTPSMAKKGISLPLQSVFSFWEGKYYDKIN